MAFSQAIGRPRRSIQSRIRSSTILVSAIGLSSVLGFQGAATSNEALKIGAGIAALAVIVQTLQLLSRHSKAVDAPRALGMIFLLSFVPTMRILLEMSDELGTRGLINAIVLTSPYYFLPVASLAVLAFMAQTQVPLDVLLRRSLPPIIALAVMLAAMGLVKISTSEVVGLHMIYNNMFIPMALLLFFTPSRRNAQIGAIGLGAVMLLSALQSSRSYLLVALYILVLVLFRSGQGRSTRWRIAAVATVVAVIFFSTVGGIVAESASSAGGRPIVDKLRLETLWAAFGEFWQSGELAALFFWEGNSRSTILIDAFASFTIDDYFFGRGVTATYDSFVTRNTIEIGYAQELFWLGLVTVIPTLLFTALALGAIFRQRVWRRTSIGSSLLAIGVVRFLDGLIYGMPVTSIYMLLYWMAVMSFALRPGARRQLFGGIVGQRLGR